MADDIKNSIEKHIEWTEYINTRLEVIYRDICNYEKQINLMNENEPNLMELLEQLNELHDTAKSFTPLKTDLIVRDIDQQIDILQNKIGVLRIENAVVGCDQTENEPMIE